jgi:hypothetical protein
MLAYLGNIVMSAAHLTPGPSYTSKMGCGKVGWMPVRIRDVSLGEILESFMPSRRRQQAGGESLTHECKWPEVLCLAKLFRNIQECSHEG